MVWLMATGKSESINTNAPAMRDIEDVILLLIILAPIRELRPSAAKYYAIEAECLLNELSNVNGCVRFELLLPGFLHDAK